MMQYRPKYISISISICFTRIYCKLSFRTVDSLSKCWFPKSFTFMGSLCLTCGRAITTMSSAKYAISRQIVSSLRVFLLEFNFRFRYAMNVLPVVLTSATWKWIYSYHSMPCLEPCKSSKSLERSSKSCKS